MGEKTFFVGNLSAGVTSAEVERLFASSIPVGKVEVKQRQDSDVAFAFVTVNAKDDSHVRDCIKKLNGVRWKKRPISVQVARESYAQRMSRDRVSGPHVPAPRYSGPPPQVGNANYEPLAVAKARAEENTVEAGTAMKNANVQEKLREVSNTFADEDIDAHFGETAPIKDGVVKNGLVCFDDDNVAAKRGFYSVTSRKRYASSSDDDDDDEKPVKKQQVRSDDHPRRPPQNEVRPQASSQSGFNARGGGGHSASFNSRRGRPDVNSRLNSGGGTSRPRYYSSSEDEDAPKDTRSGNAGSIVSNLKSFAGDVWKDSDDEDENNQRFAKKPPNRAEPYADNNRASLANERRLSALKQRTSATSAKSHAIKSDLSAIDGNKSKKIRFDQGEEDETPAKAGGQQKRAGASSLFNDDDDDEDNNEGAFSVRPQFEGRSGHRLLELQSRFASNNDDRFRLDERFKDGRGDDEDEGEVDESHAGVNDDISNEREMNMKILRNVCGDDATRSRPARDKAPTFTDSAMLRFDPSVEDSKPKQKAKKKKDATTNNSEQVPTVKTETPMPEVSKEKTHWANAEVFKKASTDANKTFAFSSGNASSGFSLLRTFGKAEDVKTDAGSDAYKTEAIGKEKKKLGFLEKNPFKYDSSDEDEDDDSGRTAFERMRAANFGRKLAEQSSKSAAAASGNRSAAAEQFFLSDGDARFDEAEEFLGGGGALDDIRQRFEEQRPELSRIMKKKLRTMTKRQKNEKERMRALKRKKFAKAKHFARKKQQPFSSQRAPPKEA